ncbi:bifunctional folylpolyglutamate synthase/dihydrofolate synthase [Aeromicrobium sp. YIM 150415]|uniref:bifunctional folylpolyglutamate synthase/dihydrofolate synthase n=1 Tax=Aeromicrobium sp. YIM 150415 TaxID=2803912 RepID=UPI001963AEAE|nr:folylpolyglutamate synthase/dihydrofolate synthase family protein [Aeromicrobium sp. YIM 150415]MBM9463282.1 bifunctional folylpolyglutamate synthase/dihydrofolate synthase [Aeromicrobium sp. YIM 150415]
MNPTLREVEAELLARWPETKLEPSLDRIRAICELLGNPQDATPLIQLTGTNGKSTTSRMIDALVRALGLRTGRFTSPHLQSITERISIDGDPLTDEEFVRAYEDVAPFARLIDDQQEHPLSFFELMVAMAYASFADAPVDAAIVEVGMGGSWDATSVADARVAVVTPIGVDHARYLGDSPEQIAVEKAGIIKPGGQVVLAGQQPEVLDVLMRRAIEVGAPVVREGIDFGVESRVPAVGGQQFTLQSLSGRYENLLLPLHGEHQARNAALALAAVETFTGAKELDPDLVRQAFGEVRSPGRLEVVRRGPAVLLDAAHNPHGVETMLLAVQEEFSFSPLVGVVAMMGDKDVEEMLRQLEPVLAHIVATENSSDRSLPAIELAQIAADIFGEERVSSAPRLDAALEEGIARAESAEGYEDAVGSGGVLVTGSVVTVGEARTLLGVTGEERP